MQLQAHYPASTQLVEDTWIELCGEAGWTADLNCSPDFGALSRYFANLDALVSAQAPRLLAMISEARVNAKSFDRNYLDGIEAAIGRAVETPRQAA